MQLCSENDELAWLFKFKLKYFTNSQNGVGKQIQNKHFSDGVTQSYTFHLNICLF